MSKVLFDACTPYYGDGTNPLEFSHTTAVGAGLLLLLMQCNTVPEVSVTYGGQALTLIGEDAAKDLMVYGLLNPPSGANTMHIEWSSNHSAYIIVYTFLGAEPKLPTQVAYDEDGGAVLSGVVIKDTRSIGADLVVRTGASMIPGADQTERTGLAADSYWLGSTSPATDPSPPNTTLNLSWTCTTGSIKQVVVGIDAGGDGVPAGMTPVLGH